jgi:hypothetical protein
VGVRKTVLTTAALVAAVVIFVLATLPPRPADIPLDAVDPSVVARTASGAFHIHTDRSDGAGDRASIAAAAARAGLKFAIFTDHGDGTRPPARPEYLSGVLCIDGVEISTNGGHYVAIDIPVAPYPLGGEASAVIEDVARLGGFGIAAHPDHPKATLAWTAWDVPLDGIEWLNADSEWRDETPMELAKLLLAYPARPAPALAYVFDRPVATLERWDQLSRARPVVALAAIDAHGGARRRSAEEDGSTFGVGPGYEASFTSLSNRVLLDRPLTGDAGTDARLVLAAVRQGRVYSVVDAIARNVVLDRGAGGMAAWSLASAPIAGASPVVVTDGERRRLEIHAPHSPGTPPVPWVLSNWTGPVAAEAVAPVASLPVTTRALAIASEWRVEKDPASSGRVSGGGAVATLEFKLRADARASQFVAAVADLAPSQAYARLRFRGRADRPMRVSVQLRLGQQRWVRSVYLSPDDRDVEIAIKDLRPAEPTTSAPRLSDARSILFVVDLVNARPGDAGAFTISDLRGASDP